MLALLMRRLGATALTATFSFASLSGALAIELPADFRAAIEQGVANGRYQSIAVALIERDQHGEWTFGTVAPDGPKPEIADAFEIGSTTRSFTGLLFGRALLEGKVHLNDTLGKLFADVHFADPSLAAATLGQLAIHRAGLPALPSNLFPRSVDDPYVQYDATALQTYLAHAHLDPADVGVYRYSDLGVALLGEALARAYRKDFRSLLASEVLAPLALTGTGFGSVPRLLDGRRDDTAASHWQYQSFVSASGLRSTLFDLSRFANAELRPDASPLRQAILLAREPRASAGGGETAFAWQIVPVESEGQSWPLLWQAGVTGGFASFVGLRTDRQRAVILLGNTSIDLSALGLALVAERQPPPPPPKRLPMPASAALAYEGLYRFDTGGDLVVRSGAEGLTMQLSGQIPQPMFDYDEDAFELGSGGQLTFARDDTKVVGAILHRNGGNVRAERLSEGAPALKRNTSAMPAKELAVYAGDYALSRSVRAHIVTATPGLRVQLTGTAPTFVQRCAVDRFCDDNGTLEVAFSRDRTGKISALDWRQGVFEARATRDDW
jgi:D-alanyl-D-alanine-carboxypeptidase/D-alanyl-D-alanine-endopeptidase